MFAEAHKMAKNNQLRKRTAISIEELIILLAGIFTGWLVGQGFTAFLLAVPIAVFIVWAYEFIKGKI